MSQVNRQGLLAPRKQEPSAQPHAASWESAALLQPQADEGISLLLQCTTGEQVSDDTVTGLRDVTLCRSAREIRGPVHPHAGDMAPSASQATLMRLSVPSPVSATAFLYE